MDPIIETDANGDIQVTYFLYTPSKPAAWLFIALFGAATLVHFILMFRFRAGFFVPLIIGGIMETFGYYGRAWASEEPGSIKPWVLQAMLIIAAPPMISATVYMSLSRMIRALNAHQNAMMSPRGMTPLFVTTDVVAFISQIAGVGLQASTSQSTQEIGKKVVLGGLIFQLVLLAFFGINIHVFHRRQASNPTTIGDHPQVPPWRRLIWILFSIAIAIFVRNLVRAIEYAQGPRGVLAREEAFVYVFDAALIFWSVAALFVSHPGRFVRRAAKVHDAIGRAPQSVGGEKTSDTV